MFDNLSINKTPNNLCEAFVTNCSNIVKHKYGLPYEEYNELGEFIGYSWHYGDTVTLEFNIEGELTLESNSLIYTSKGGAPTSNTVGVVNQKAYNTTDLISWTCTSSNNILKEYVWTQDEEWITPNSGTNTYVTVKDFLEGKYLTINIYNFRYEKEFISNPLPAQEILDFNIDSKLIKKPNCDNNTNIDTSVEYEPLSRGVHYLTLILTDENNEYIDTLIGQQDCPLIIK